VSPTVNVFSIATGERNSEVALTVNLSDESDPREVESPTPKFVIPAEPETPREEKIPTPSTCNP